jgi:excisionase family DNA binding protein
MSDTLLSYPAAAAKLGISQMSVRRLVERGKLRTVRVGERRIFIVAEDIEQMMKPVVEQAADDLAKLRAKSATRRCRLSRASGS